VDITAFIRELLFSHDCVIVPGFGGFIGNYTPAHIEKTTGTFYPPVKLISFNRNLSHNDGLLAGRISESLNVNYGDARYHIERFVTDIRKKLESGEKLVFDHIGTFVTNHEGNLQFEPDRSVNYHLDSYGLEPFQCIPLEGYDVRKRVIKQSQTGPVKRLRIRKILWRAAVIVPLLTVVVAVPLTTDVFRPRLEVSTMNPLVSAELEHNKAAIDKSFSAEITSVPAVSQLTEGQVSEPAMMPVLESSPVKYQLITGSFQSRINAERQAEMLKNVGFTPDIIIASNGFYRVSAALCPDLATAEARKIEISQKFPETWILRKR